MALKVRLWQQGCKNRRCYRVVVADSRSPRDGKCIEVLGWYNPTAREESGQWSIQAERLQHWLSVGAQISPTVSQLAMKATPEVMKQYGSSQEAKRTKIRQQRRKRK